MLNNLAHGTPTGKFVALFADGSGANIFFMARDHLFDAEGDEICLQIDTVEVLLDCGYFHWLPLPDDYKLWYETK